MKSGIYKIENIINGKMYVGRSKNIHKRLGAHKSELRNNKHGNPHLQNAWNEYGETNFVCLPIEHCEIDLLVERESYWIAELGVLNRDKGYNIAEENSKGQYTEEYKKNLAEKCRIKTLAQHAKSRKEGKLQIVVIDLETQEREYFEALIDCPYNLKNKNFNFVQKKFKSSTYNKTEEQIQKEFDATLLRYKSFIQSNSIGEIKLQTIYKFDKKTCELIDTYESIPDAAINNDAEVQKIRDCVSGLAISYKGFRYSTSDTISPINYSHNRKMCYEGVIYNTINECITNTGQSKANLILAMRSKNRPNCYWIDTPNKKPVYIPSENKVEARKVICQGIVYRSVTEASKILNVPVKKIYEVLSKRAKTTRGYSFEYETVEEPVSIS